ncbi:hypothetical protein AYO39_02255 [Actinobacteria bacterium SCGC AG-212-D09]|nr:hypothetical protein AYO39_02255 [Actinobacteria bacterium SCGC AG-212-D09]
MRPIERIAARLKGRDGRFSDRDIARIAEAVCWDAPDWLSTDEFTASLEPFVAGLNSQQAGRVRMRVWEALPEYEQDQWWEMLEEEVGFGATPARGPSAREVIAAAELGQSEAKGGPA